MDKDSGCWTGADSNTSVQNILIVWLNLFNAELSPKRQATGGEREPKRWRNNVSVPHTTLSPPERAAMRAVLRFRYL